MDNKFARYKVLTTLALLSAGLAMVIVGCAKTVSDKSAVVSSVQGGASPAIRGFFGSDAALLQPGQEGQAAMVYIAPNAQWTQYDKILLEPVEFWDDPNTKISPSDQDILTAYFYNQLKTELQ
ncbi:MAG: DUF3313 family protein, partial [Terriglobia bacterium]